MAHSFGAFLVPQQHITYLQQHPGSVHDYLDGRVPDATDPSSLPTDWPTEEPESMGSWSINHRNTDLYHWILNGGPELVTGAGSIFQTWYEPDHQSVAIKLDAFNERFAFGPEQLPELAALVSKVDVPAVLKAFTAWCKSQGKDYEPDEYACMPFVDEFTMFGEGLQDAIRKGHGIVW
ncbi:MAG: hypothetical protein IPK97_18420 [Ahniella sp.]|nr:hypothetical protein [Ahniella sp.]